MNQSSRLRTTDFYVTEVEHLWRPEPVVISPDLRVSYLEQMPFALALDRQSEHLKLTDKERTGHEARVGHVLNQARALRVHLPEPVEIPHRQEGELQYAFDRRFWFVDGVGRNATGFSASPYARPELWRAWGTAKELGKFQCAPAYIIVGEATRLFRDENWLSIWVKAFWANHIGIYVCGFGEVTTYTLPGLIAYVQALSGWLVRARRDARAAKKRRLQLSHNNPPYGLQFRRGEDDTSEVWTDPYRWNNLRRAVYRLGEGVCANAMQLFVWMRATLTEEDGTPFEMSLTTLRKFLLSETPEGNYLSYHTQSIPKLIQDRNGLHRDLDLTPSGNRRYVEEIHLEEAVRFPIHYHTPEEQIDPSVLLRARLAMSQKGRPCSPDRTIPTELDFPLLPERLLRCAVCGSSIAECPPRLREKKKDWTHFSQEQDLLMIRRMDEGVNDAQIAHELEAIVLKETGHAYTFDWQRIKNRRARLGVGRRKTFEENLAIVENFWEDPFRARFGVWRLQCRCVSRFVEKEGLTWDAARHDPRAQHVRCRTGCASQVVWDLLLNAYSQEQPYPPGEPETPIDETRLVLQALAQQRRDEVDILNAQYRAGAFGDPLSPIAIAEVKRIRDPILEDLHHTEARLGSLEDEYLTRAANQRTAEEYRAILRLISRERNELSLDPNLPLQIIIGITEETRVHLEEGWVELTTIFDDSPMKHMRGSLEGTGGSVLRGSDAPCRVGFTFSQEVTFQVQHFMARLHDIKFRVQQEAHQRTIQRSPRPESIHPSVSVDSLSCPNLSLR